MTDLGDLREGVLPKDLDRLAAAAMAHPELDVVGLGTNLTCYGGVIPDTHNLGHLAELARRLRETFGLALPVVSAGNSSSLPLLMDGPWPEGLTNLRLGESIVLGRETATGKPLAGTFQDACTLVAEVIEVREKPSVPEGTVGRDAFGQVPTFVDRGMRPRAILALGRQDTVVDGLTPLLPGAIVLGASSDHLLVDVGDVPVRPAVGDELRFGLNYGALLAAATSPFVHQVFLGG